MGLKSTSINKTCATSLKGPGGAISKGTGEVYLLASWLRNVSMSPVLQTVSI